MVLTLVVGLASRVDVYESFVKGAAEALPIMRRVLPYTVAMIFAVRLMEASGAFDMLSSALSGLGGLFGIPPALIPLMIMRPFSGGGSMGLLAGLLTSLEPDSFVVDVWHRSIWVAQRRCFIPPLCISAAQELRKQVMSYRLRS